MPGFSDMPTGAPLMVWGLAYAEADRLFILAMLFPLILNFGHTATILHHHLIGLTALGKLLKDLMQHLIMYIQE